MGEVVIAVVQSAAAVVVVVVGREGGLSGFEMMGWPWFISSSMRSRTIN